MRRRPESVSITAARNISARFFAPQKARPMIRRAANSMRFAIADTGVPGKKLGAAAGCILLSAVAV